tara:strand:- start:321 stop:506 length:186 start_codon:yes stop_codon:yes gene_type:complete
VKQRALFGEVKYSQSQPRTTTIDDENSADGLMNPLQIIERIAGDWQLQVSERAKLASFGEE